MPRHHRYRFEVVRDEEVAGKSPVCDRFREYWWQIKPPMGLPRRQDVRLPDLRRHAAHAVFMDVESGKCFEHAFTLRVRLIGTAVAEHFGEMTGCDIADMENQAAARRIYYMSGLAIQERRPVMSIVHGIAPESTYKDAFALYMPLADESGDIRKVMVAVDVTYFSDEELA